MAKNNNNNKGNNSGNKGNGTKIEKGYIGDRGIHKEGAEIPPRPPKEKPKSDSGNDKK